MRVLHVTDTHLGMRRLVRGAPRGWTRAADHLAALVEAVRPAMEGRVDAVVHSGDLFDRSRPPPAAIEAAVTVFRKLARRVPVVLIPGNHDRRGLRRHLPVPVPGLHVVARPTRVVIGDLALAAVPFRRDARAWAEDALQAVGPGADVLVAHQAFDGHAVPGLVFRVGRQRDTLGDAHVPPGVRHVMCGHIHPRQVVEVGGATVVCPGSTERTSFSERDQTKGYAMWRFDADVRWRFVDLPTRRMWRVDTPADLADVGEGDLVRTSTELAEAVLQRGGWLVGKPTWPRPPARASPQLALFGA